MFYIKFTASTPYSGTENSYCQAFVNRPTDRELEDYANEFCTANAEGFEYLVTGWGYDNYETEEEMEEALNNYYADCDCDWKEISEEEYLEEMGEI